MANVLKLYVLAVTVVSIAGLAYVYIKPPPSMLIDRDGVAHFTPPVMHAETGEPVALGRLIRHFQGD
jgi:hypothetical protein